MEAEFDKLDPRLKARYNAAKEHAGLFASVHDDVRELVRPTAQEFHGRGTSGRGQRRGHRIYDSTALWAMEQLASGLHAYLTNPSDRWFEIGFKGVPRQDMNHEQLLWAESVTDLLNEAHANPKARFHQSVYETYLDLASFGTAVIYQSWNREAKSLSFRAFPLASCYPEEGPNGIVDGMHRDTSMRLSQILEAFPKARLPRNIASSNPESEWIVSHSVVRSFEFKGQRLSSIQRRYTSTYHIVDSDCVLEEGGYDVFPYSCPRWTTLAGDVFGRGPAVTAISDIELLNLMYKELIVAAQLANRPPLVLDDDSYMLPIAYQPGKLIFRTPGSADPYPIQSGGHFNITLEIMQQKRDQVAKAFHVDWLLREKKKERQTILEVSDDREEMLRQLSPILGRFESEMLSPQIKLSYFYLDRAGLIPPAPESAEGMPLEIVYTSPAAKAQLGGKAAKIMQFLSDVAPLAANEPEIMEGINMADLGRELALMRDVTRRVLYSPAQTRQRQADRAKQQSGQMAAAQAGDMAGALKDVATAQEKGLSLM